MTPRGHCNAYQNRVSAQDLTLFQTATTGISTQIKRKLNLCQITFDHKPISKNISKTISFKKNNVFSAHLPLLFYPLQPSYICHRMRNLPVKFTLVTHFGGCLWLTATTELTLTGSQIPAPVVVVVVRWCSSGCKDMEYGWTFPQLNGRLSTASRPL